MTNGDADKAKDATGATPKRVDALRPIFRGGRFDEGQGYPATALGELAAYAKLVEAMALKIHREREQRQRAVPGYADRIRLRLLEVEPGSQIPVLVCAPDFYDVNVEAADAVVEQLDDLSDIDHDLQRLFRAFGKSLNPDESIELPSTRKPFRYTQGVRSMILAGARQTHTDAVDVLCRITQTSTPDRAESSLTVKLADGAVVRLHMDADEIRRELDRGVAGRLLRVSGVGRFPPGGKLAEIAVVEDIRVIDDDLPGPSESLASQFDTLKRAGFEPTAPFRLFLEYCIAEGVEARPYIVATEDGIEAEWHIDRLNITATLHDNDRVYVHVTDLDTGMFREATVTCDYPGAGQLVALSRGEHND